MVEYAMSEARARKGFAYTMPMRLLNAYSLMSNNNLLTPHFALQEFTECYTVRKYGIANEM